MIVPPIHVAWIWAALAVAVAGLLFAAFAILVGDRARGRRRCPKCWYDMAGTPSLVCPECGYTAPTERNLFRARRRWLIGIVALLFGAAPIVGLVATGRGRQMAKLLLPRWRQTQRFAVGRADVRLYVERLSDFGDRPVRVLINGPNGVVLDHEDWQISLGVAVHDRSLLLAGDPDHSIETDLTGDGTPDLAVDCWSGGAHCCSTLFIVSLGATPELYATLDAGPGSRLEQAADGSYRFVVADLTFDYWKAPHAASPMPAVYLRPAAPPARGLVVSTADMLTRAPDLAALKASAAAIRDAGQVTPDLWRTMLDLLYSGHPREAWKFFDAAWPAEVQGKDQFKAEFLEQLDKSPYWPQINAVFGDGL